MNGDIRQLLHRQLSQDGPLSGMLARYSGGPAIFYQKAPSDSRPGWGDPRYPRADFSVDMRQDPERHTAGTLACNIFVTNECAAENGTDPDRAIEERLKELISGTFYTDGGGGTICAEWDRSDEFSLEGNEHGTSQPEVYGLTAAFELMAFPEQLTADPDPIEGLNRWTKERFGTVSMIAYDRMPEVWKPSDENPAVYWRFEGASGTDRQSYAVTWLTGQFAAHVIAGTVAGRNRWLKAIMERARAEGEIILADGSPMFLKQASVRHGADPLREGQLLLTGQYGILTGEPEETARFRLDHAYFSKA